MNENLIVVYPFFNRQTNGNESNSEPRHSRIQEQVGEEKSQAKASVCVCERGAHSRSSELYSPVKKLHEEEEILKSHHAVRQTVALRGVLATSSLYRRL